MALAPGQSISLEVPDDARGLIISGANIARLPVGTAAGEINRVPIRIGDVAGLGLSAAITTTARATPCRQGIRPVRCASSGQAAWIDGAARFPLARTA